MRANALAGFIFTAPRIADQLDVLVGIFAVKVIEGVSRQGQRFGKSPQKFKRHVGHFLLPESDHITHFRQRFGPLIGSLHALPYRASAAFDGRAFSANIKLLAVVRLAAGNFRSRAVIAAKMR